VNSRTFKDLWNESQGLSSTCPVFTYFQDLEFRRKKFKDFQGCVGTLGYAGRLQSFRPLLSAHV